MLVFALLIGTAVPAYKDHLIRARITEGLNLASAAKLAVTDTAFTNNALPKTQKETGYMSPAPTKYVSSVIIGNSGVVTISYTKLAGGGTLKLKPILRPNGELKWILASDSSLPNKYVPPSLLSKVIT